MTLRCFSFPRTRLAAALRPRSWGRVLGLALLVALAGGCGGESSTDTGNPPGVLGQKLRLTATDTGVIITGDAGAVPAGSRVDVVNTATGQTATTTAAEDGSFDIEVAGSATDEYRVYAASGDQSWRTQLTSSGVAATEPGLAGLDFLLQSVDGHTLVPDTTVRLSFFGASELSFNAGCNSYSGTYSLCDGKLCISELGGTEIGCGPGLHEQDEWVAELLQSSPVLTRAGAALTLADADATLEFLDSEVADPDRQLTGRVWGIDTFIQNGAASSLPTAAQPTLQFGADGSLRVYDSCNTGTGSYTRAGSTLTISGLGERLGYTAIYCPAGSDSVQVQTQRVMAAGEVVIEIDAARLTILRGEVGLSATTD
jgi:heat shock protein HslJ